ncbi:MAG: P-II family nitrogen regulator [Lachnospiraceae bacterium]|nr:P-II family nitrogen regulator [Lachnospiraceae bacterium]
MDELYLLIGIIERERLLPVVSLYEEQGLHVHHIALGRGTASGQIMNDLGMSSAEKALIFSLVTGDSWKAVKKALRSRFRIDVPGTGIAFTVPLSSIGGKRELLFLTDSQPFEKGEESEMKNTAHELLVVVSNQGYNEMVMEAAREAGAGGGTVIHAQGTGTSRAERFLGISLASEKDMVFIVTRTEKKNAIMQAVMQKAGMTTKAQSIIFSLPVTDTAGLKLEEDEE